MPVFETVDDELIQPLLAVMEVTQVMGLLELVVVVGLQAGRGLEEQKPTYPLRQVALEHFRQYYGEASLITHHRLASKETLVMVEEAVAQVVVAAEGMVAARVAVAVVVVAQEVMEPVEATFYY